MAADVARQGHEGDAEHQLELSRVLFGGISSWIHGESGCEIQFVLLISGRHERFNPIT